MVVPSSAEVKNAWRHTLLPQYAFMAWCLVKHRDNFTFTLAFNVNGLEAKERTLSQCS